MAQQQVIEMQDDEDFNDYLDNGQTILDYMVRECRYPLARVIEEDPARILRNWLKCRKSALGGSYGGVGIGVMGLIGGVFAAAPLLMLAGVAGAAVSAFCAKHHIDAIEFIDHEASVLNRVPELLEAMAVAESGGARTSALLNAYNGLIQKEIEGGIDLSNPKHIQQEFERKLQRAEAIGKTAIAFGGRAEQSKAIAPSSKAIGADTKLRAVDAIATRPQTAPSSPWDEPKGLTNWDEVIGNAMEVKASAGQEIKVGAIAPNPSDPQELWDFAVPGNEADNEPPSNATELLDRLKAECPELLRLLKSAPIRIVGMQRTGKSTFARKLALLRKVLLPGHRVAWSSPHREVDNPVPAELMPFGCNAKGKDFKTIEKVWRGCQNAIDMGKRLDLTVVWDEFGGYIEFSDPDLLGVSLLSVLRESTKHSYFPVFVAHGDQATFYPGLKNFLTTFKDSTIKVEALGVEDPIYGTMQPSGDFEVTKLNGDKVLFSLPKWLTVELLLSLLPDTNADVYKAVERESSDRWLGTVQKVAA